MPTITAKITKIDYNEDSIKVSDADVDKAAEVISQATKKIFTEEELRPKIMTLKQAAATFADNYNWLIANLETLTAAYEHLTKAQMALHDKDQASLDLFASYNEAVHNVTGVTEIQSVFQQIYSSVFMFQKALNDFFDQQMILTLVYRTKVLNVYIDDYSQYLTYTIHRGDVNARFSNLGELINKASQVVDLIQLHSYNMQSLKNIQHGRASALWRYNRSKSVIKTYNENKKNAPEDHEGGLVLWHRPNWWGMWVYNRGDIQEAYATIILNRDIEAINAEYASSDINTILDHFMAVVSGVDAVSGVFRGDYSENQNAIQYAIKSSKASALGYRQFAEIAQNILSEGISDKLLQEWEKNIKYNPDHRNEIIKDGKFGIGNALLEALTAGAAAK